MMFRFIKTLIFIVASHSSLASAKQGHVRKLDAQNNNAPGALTSAKLEPEYPFCSFKTLGFSSADDEFTFQVQKAEGEAAGILKVDVKDCCIPGDKWGIEIDAQGNNDVSGVGDGETSDYSGDAAVAPLTKGTVKISYVEGVDEFPAGMDVKFCSSRAGKNGDPIVVTQL
mmetsp:Transcript_8302/g.13135  ORF Transcript_8302/g.13135 Transcript_8302/m.13135 type:complete len:170 (-) Transcript_8302:151-660(-)